MTDAQRPRRAHRAPAARAGARGRVRRRGRLELDVDLRRPRVRAWWGGLWADRVRYSRFAEQAVEYGLSDADELQAIAEAFLRWADSHDAVFVIPHVEILARG